jgi:hypothetical protein
MVIAHYQQGYQERKQVNENAYGKDVVGKLIFLVIENPVF